MAVYNYDVVVLGSGPAGEGAAMNAATAGRKVAMVDSPAGRWQLHSFGHHPVQGPASLGQANHPLQHQPDVPGHWRAALVLVPGRIEER